MINTKYSEKQKKASKSESDENSENYSKNLNEDGIDINEVENKITFSDLVQVPVRKLDHLLNLVGELIIERDRIIANNGNDKGSNEFSRLNRISSDLQYSVMDVRLVQGGFLFNKFHRVVRDAAASENKKVSLKLSGTETEIDRNVLQIISDSLIHLIRNAIGHGIEIPDDRRKINKSEEGIIHLKAKNESDAVIITIEDDGNGIEASRIKEKAISKGLLTYEFAAQLTDQEIIHYIFEPGFSTMEKVTAISGRGVGMDVVKKAIDSIGGNISIESKPGVGTKVMLRLPSSMAVKGTLLFSLNNDEYAIPLAYTEAVVSFFKTDIHKVGKGLVATHLDKTISIVFLKDLFQLGFNEKLSDKSLHKTFDSLHPEVQLDIVVVEFNNRTVGLVVDKLLQQKEIVEKPLMKPVDSVRFISGVTILGNGHVCLVLNVSAIVNFIFTQSFSGHNSGVYS